MATRIQVRKLANPRRRVKAKRRNATKRRKMSPKQIRHFGTKAQKAALKRKKNPVRKVSATKTNRRRKRRSNPALVVTLGAMNPRRTKKRRNKPVAAKRNRRRRVNATRTKTNRRRRRNPVARKTNRRRTRRRNATRIVVVAPKANRRRRRNPARRNSRRRVHHRRRNPMSTSLFGAPLFSKGSMELVGGGLVGVAAAKFIPTLLPVSLAGGITSSNIGKTVMTGIAAVIGGWAGSKVSPQFGQGMLFGGLMQTFSVGLNAFLPQVWTQLNPQLGDLMPGQFAVPQNPLRLPPPPPMAAPPAGSQARITMNGLGRAYGSAF